MGRLKNCSSLNLCFDNLFKLISKKFKITLERTWKEVTTLFRSLFHMLFQTLLVKVFNILFSNDAIRVRNYPGNLSL